MASKTAGLHDEVADLHRQIGLLKGRVRSREVERKAKAVDVQKLEHRLRLQEKSASSPPPPEKSARPPRVPAGSTSPPFR